MKNQTAVEWLLNEIDMQFPHINIRWKQVMIEKALEMEEQQIENAYDHHRCIGNFDNGIEYYNETFKNI